MGLMGLMGLMGSHAGCVVGGGGDVQAAMLGCKAWAVAGSLRASNREIPLDALHEAVGVGMGRVDGWLAGGWRHDAARAGRGVVRPHGQGRG